jgi:hypothetical protein
MPLATIALLALSVRAEPTVVGRPLDFSGAVGGPFVARWDAEPTTVTVEEPITLALSITGTGRLREMPRPALSKLGSFKAFAVEELDERFVDGNPSSREFRYRVRPRTADVKEIPRFKLVYFNPHIVPASRGYQTTYAEAVPLNVLPRAPAVNAPAEVPAWMLDPPTADEIVGRRSPWADWFDWLLERNGIDFDQPIHGLFWFFLAVGFLLPPVLCLLWFHFWRRLHADAALQTVGRRNRESAAATRAIERSGGRADVIAAAMLGYLRNRNRLLPNATTPADVATALSAEGCPEPAVKAVVTILKRCDAARFSREACADPSLAADAVQVVLDREAVA